MTPPWHLANGFRYSGIHCGIRPETDRLDLALLVSDPPAVAAGVFTQNQVAAAPVHVCRQRLPSKSCRGIVISSGNANACTGQQGYEDARRMAALAAQYVGGQAEQMLVCSTGIIGRPLPMPMIEAGIKVAAEQLQSDAEALDRAAHAILTTDTKIKVSTRAVQIGDSESRLTGFAKGAAMIGPNMATMLAFVLTDAALEVEHLTHLVKRAADHSFNCISVEGHTSTNDSLLFLANGSGPPLKGEARSLFDQAAIEVCTDLARAIAGDAEGATHLVTIEVDGLRTPAEARRVAKAVADSPLVKTALFGADPNWGRIVSAAGYCGVHFEERDLSLWLGDMLLYQSGTPQSFDAAQASRYIKNNREITLRLQFNLGSNGCRFWTCDLSYDYVRLNAEYST